MALDTLPGVISVPSRDQVIAKYKRDFAFRAPAGTLTGDGTQPAIDAAAIADTVMPLYASIVQAGNNLVLEAASGAAVDTWAKRAGLLREPPSGASGYAIVSTSTTGSTIFAGDQLVSETGTKYQCLETAAYLNGGLVPIQGIDTGTATNLEPGSKLTWVAPRSGCSPTCVVAANADGSGLTDGRPVESDEDLKARIIERFSNPPTSGNDPDIQALAEACPGLTIERCFTYPCILGPGTCAVVFTMRPQKPGGSRIPSSAQVALMQAYLTGVLPHDFSVFVCDLVAVPTDTVVESEWATTVPGWADAVPWPPYFLLVPGSGSGGIYVKAVTSATAFQLGNSNANYSSIPAPQVGQTVGVYDKANAAFRRKKILTVSGSGPWNITCDTAENASDTGYVPVVGQRASPWSDSLDSLAGPVLAYFDGLGPGEQLDTFFDLARQRRNPPSPRFFPSVIGNRLIAGLLTAPSVDDVVLLEPAVPFSTPVPVAPAVYSELLTLGDFAAFPEST